MPKFDSRVEIEFTPGVWTDVSPWVESYSSSRGRSYEWDEMETGTAAFTLNNADGRFTPGNAASPYYPNVKPRKAVRVIWEVGFDEPQFYGWIERWPLSLSNGASSISVTCSDSLGFMARKKFDRPLLHELLMAYKPTWFFPLNETSGSAHATSITQNPARLTKLAGTPGEEGYFGGGALTLSGEADWGDCWVVDRKTVTHYNTSLFASMSPRLALDAGVFPAFGTAGQMFGFACAFEIGGIVREAIAAGEKEWNGTLFSLTDQSGQNILNVSLRSLQYSSGLTEGVRLRVTSPFLSSPIDNYYDAFGPDGLTSGWVQVYHDPASPSQLTTRLNGYPVSGTWTAGTPMVVKDALVGYCVGPGQGQFKMSNVSVWAPGATTGGVVYDDTLSVDSALYAAVRKSQMSEAFGAPSYTGQVYASDFIKQLARIAGLANPVNVSPDITALFLPDPAIGDSVLELARKVAESCGGTLLASRLGPSIEYANRETRFGIYGGHEHDAPYMSFKDSEGSAPEPGLTFDMDEGKIINRVTVNRADHTSFSATDQDSIDEYGPFSMDVDSVVLDDHVAQGMADWRVHIRSQPLIRCDEVEIAATASAVDLFLLSRLDLLYVVSVDELPPSAPFTSGTFFVEGMVWNMSKEGETADWSLTLQLSPVTGWHGFIIEDATYGVLDSPNAFIVY